MFGVCLEPTAVWSINSKGSFILFHKVFSPGVANATGKYYIFFGQGKRGKKSHKMIMYVANMTFIMEH